MEENERGVVSRNLIGTGLLLVCWIVEKAALAALIFLHKYRE